MSKEYNTGGGVSFLGLLAILFIALKLLAIGPVASWSWWWVLSPLWLPIGIVLICVVFFGAIYMIVKR